MATQSALLFRADSSETEVRVDFVLVAAVLYEGSQYVVAWLGDTEPTVHGV